jgi:hypothetical protein
MAISQLWSCSFHFEKNNIKTHHAAGTELVVAAGRAISTNKDGSSELAADEAPVRTALANNSIAIPPGTSLVFDHISAVSTRVLS